MKLAIVATLLALAGAIDHIEDHEYLVAMPMHQYRQDCGTKSNLRIIPNMKSQVALLQGSNVPGAGIDKFKPFEEVQKDGFLLVDCVKDYMYYRGDKFGDNKHDYKLGPVSNVSIVHYDAFVAKEDRQDMTQKVCFEFCRTVPNMGFFGLVNGRGCYCTPYFNAMESDSTQCDANCVGDNTLMCGGKSKSSVFAMHMCDSTKDDLKSRVTEASGLAGGLRGFVVNQVDRLSGNMQSMGAKWQKKFGAVGDSGAANLMQSAKQFAGELEHAGEDCVAFAEKLEDVVSGTQSLTNFKNPTVVTKAERAMESIDELLAGGIEAEEKTTKLHSAGTAGKLKNVTGAAKQYYPVMYFVDKKFEKVPSTCAGDAVAKPIYGRTEDACAAECDRHIHSCVGFQYFKDGDDQMCFLFSRFNTGFYYTGCGGSASFLQAAESSGSATCYAKVSKFEGTTLKPNPSGKCAQCFKELTKANRCFQ